MLRVEIDEHFTDASYKRWVETAAKTPLERATVVATAGDHKVMVWNCGCKLSRKYVIVCDKHEKD